MNLFRISRSATSTSAFNAAYTVSGLAFPVTDHNLPTSGYVTFAPTELSKDISVTATTDARNYEGWETVNLALDPKSQFTAIGGSIEAQVFIRDSTQPANAVPPVDTDRDGLTDVFETANALNPNVSNLLGTDTDHDGASDLDEQKFGLNPNLPDTNGDGVSDGAEASKKRGFTSGLNTVPIKFAVGSCFKCHQTTLKAGDSLLEYQVSSKPLAFIQNYVRPGSTPGADTSRVEKIFNVEVGRSYPIEIQGEIRKDVLNPLATYTAEILPAEPGSPTFILDDPNGLLGVGRPASGIDTKTATLIVPKVELTWLTKPSVGNVEIDDNPPNFGGGKRIFVGSITPSENLPRNTVILKVKVTPSLPSGSTVQLKSIDVDDTTDAKRFDRNGVIDSNGSAGDDNFTDTLSTPKAGKFVANSQQTYSTTLDVNGEASVEFQVGMQPGNNYRIAATVITPNNLSSLQVAAPTGNYFVSADTDQILGGFNGALSPVLTVWRKLYLEIDSMLAPTTTGPEANVFMGTITKAKAGVPKSGQSTIYLVNDNSVWQNNQMQNGTFTITGDGSFPVIGNTTFEVGIGRIFKEVIVSGAVTASADGATYSLVDDDERAVTSRQLPRLPMDGLSGQIINGLVPSLGTVTINGVAEAYKAAFIQVVDANAAGFNPVGSRNIPFFRNKDVFDNPILLSGVFDGVKNLTDGPFFWAHTVTFGFQPSVQEDGDPNIESPLTGVTAENGVTGNAFGYSVVYNEAVVDYRVEQELGFANPIQEQNTYWAWLIGNVAHETGHAPGRHYESTDHAEGDLMRPGAGALTGWNAFAPTSFLRFRKASSWTGGFP